MREQRIENRKQRSQNDMDCPLFTVHCSRRESGQVLIGVTILFTAIITVLMVGVVGPIVLQSQIVTDLRSSKQTYFGAESLAEDMAYRYKTNKRVAASESLTLGSVVSSATVTTNLGTQQITSKGNANGLQRTVKLSLTQGSGISFNYGTQTGNGGFVLNNNAGVNGNVYSNGSITGSNGAFVTGTAVAANSVALTADQVNNTPMPPTTSITFGTTTASQDVAQSFQISTNAPANKISFYIKKIGTPANATVRITSDNGGKPAASSLTTATLNASLVSTSYGWVDFVFPSGVNLQAGVTYWIVIDVASNSTSNYYVLGANTAYGSGQAKVGQYGGSWNSTAPSGLDAYFQFYIGGVTSTISNVTIGQGGTGDAWAHTVTRSTIAGTNYCQTGSGNNTSCNTSKGDPSPVDYPVSDGNIADWKTAANAGIIYTGDKTISSATSLGPAEITGNLIINATLTLTGVVYVHGSISASNNAHVNLDSSFGDNGTILLSDGRISLSNGVQFAGVAGHSNSYILLLTTSNCPTDSSCSGQNAIEISNNVGTVIINAQNGKVHVSNNAGASEITADTLIIDNNATITYSSGLANSVFTTGPSGGYSITSWKEGQ